MAKAKPQIFIPYDILKDGEADRHVIRMMVVHRYDYLYRYWLAVYIGRKLK